MNNSTATVELMKFPFIQTRYLFTSVIVVLMAFMLATTDYGDDFLSNMVIGFSMAVAMFVIVILVMRKFRFRSQLTRMAVAGASLIAGEIVGFIAGILFSGRGLSEFLLPRINATIIVFALVLIIGFLIWYVIYAQERIARDAAKIQKEKIQRLTIEKQMVETNSHYKTKSQKTL